MCISTGNPTPKVVNSKGMLPKMALIQVNDLLVKLHQICMNHAVMYGWSFFQHTYNLGPKNLSQSLDLFIFSGVFRSLFEVGILLETFGPQFILNKRGEIICKLPLFSYGRDGHQPYSRGL